MRLTDPGVLMTEGPLKASDSLAEDQFVNTMSRICTAEEEYQQKQKWP